ncbi:MAG: diacylglycerol kinase family protein [Acidobacteriota bacterium]
MDTQRDLFRTPGPSPSDPPPPTSGVLLANLRSGASNDAEETDLRAAAADAGLEVVELAPGLDVRGLIERRRASGTKLFVVAGGDGSVHSAAQGLVGTDATLAVIPMGSMNHFARDLGLPLDWRQALQVAVSGSTKNVDVGRINDRYFLNNVLIGVYVRISESRERYRGRVGKWRAYLQGIRMALRHFPDVALVVETSEGTSRIRTQMFTVSVGLDDLSRLGFLAPRTDFDAGTLHVYWLPFLTRSAFAFAMTRYVLGVAETFGDFQSLATPRLRLDSPRRRIQVATDGELSWLAPPIEVEVVAAGLRVRVP